MVGQAGAVVASDPVMVLDADTAQGMRDLEATRQSVLRHLVEVMEEERRQLAVDIHDDSIQAMLAVGMRLGMLRAKSTDAQQRRELGKLEGTVRRTVVRLRDLIFELSPPALECGGFVEAIRDALDQVGRQTGISCRLTGELATEPPLHTVALAYRLFQEALANVRAHARAATVEVRVEEADGFIGVTVRDDGRGFRVDPDHLPVAHGHLGLLSMRRRCEAAGGRFAVTSQPWGGTRVSFWLPTSS